MISIARYLKKEQTAGNPDKDEIKDNDIVVLYDNEQNAYLSLDVSDAPYYYYHQNPNYLSRLNRPVARKLVFTKSITPYSLWKVHSYMRYSKRTYNFKPYYNEMHDTEDRMNSLTCSGVWFYDKYGNLDKNMRYSLADICIYNIDDNNVLITHDDSIPKLQVIPYRPSLSALQSRETDSKSNKLWSQKKS